MSKPFRAGLLSVTFREKPVEDIIKLVASSGLEGIEWGGDVHLPPGMTTLAERVRRWTEEAGLETSAYGSYYKFEDIDPEAVEKGPEIEAVLDTTEALGTRMIRIWPGSRGSVEASRDWREAVGARTREFARLAADRGLELGFEFHDHSLTDTPESTLALLKAIDRPNVSTFWQTNRSGGHDEARKGLERVCDQVSNVHCHHLVPDRNPPFELMEKGGAEWREYLEILAESGRNHWVSIEFVKDGSVASFERDAASLREWVSLDI